MTKSLINTEDLHRAVDNLIQGERIKIVREDNTTEHKPVPSLWTQLEGAVPYSGNGGSAVAKSKPPITTGVVALLIDITSSCNEGIVDLDGTSRRDTPRNLRAIAAALDTLSDTDLTAWWTEKIRDWVTKARALLHLDPDRPRHVRGAACPQCGEKTVTTLIDKEPVRTPALHINWTAPEHHTTTHTDVNDWLVRAIECKACTAVWWRGDIEQLIGAMLNANTTQETMTIDGGVS